MKIDSKASFHAAVAEGVPCPFMATMVKQGKLEISPEGQVNFDQLREALALVGVSFGTREVLVRGTQSVEKDRLTKAGKLVAGMESFDITKLKDTTLMHTGDLKIRRHGFSQEKLDQLLSYSSGNGRLTLKDLARAQEAAVEKDPGIRGKIVGMAELSALLRLFGTRDASGELGLTTEALTALFRDGEFPKGFDAGKVSLGGVFSGMAAIAFHQVFTTAGRAAAGLDKALERLSPFDQSGVTSLGKAICPVGMRPAVPPASKAELQAIHSQSE